jgi:hypothetical protein
MIAESRSRPAVAARRPHEIRRFPERTIDMRWTRLAPALLALLVLDLTPGFAGSIPNFSGTWQMDKSRSTVQSERPLASLATRASLTMVIQHRDPELRIEQHGSLMGTERTLVTVYYTDGREASNRGARGEVITSKSHWEKGTLITDSRIVRGQGTTAQTMTRREVMSLSEDGKSLVMDGTRNTPGEDKPDSARMVFLKK